MRVGLFFVNAFHMDSHASVWLSHASVWPLGLWTPTIRCAPWSCQYGLPRFAVAHPAEGVVWQGRSNVKVVQSLFCKNERFENVLCKIREFLGKIALCFWKRMGGFLQQLGRGEKSL